MWCHPTYLPFRPSNAYGLLAFAIVVEVSPVRGLHADYPIFMILILSHLIIFHIYVVVHKTLRTFQQLDKFFHVCHHTWVTNFLSPRLRFSTCIPLGRSSHFPFLHLCFLQFATLKRVYKILLIVSYEIRSYLHVNNIL